MLGDFGCKWFCFLTVVQVGLLLGDTEWKKHPLGRGMSNVRPVAFCPRDPSGQFFFSSEESV